MQRLFAVLALCGAVLSMHQYSELKQRLEREHLRAEALAQELAVAQARLEAMVGGEGVRFVGVPAKPGSGE